MRGYLDGGVFHRSRGCPECEQPRYELPESKALKMGATLCSCVTDG